MLTNYLKAAMRRAKYEILPEDGLYYGEVEGFAGVFATAKTLEECRELLESVLEGWLLLSLWRHLPIPILEGMDLTVTTVQEVA